MIESPSHWGCSLYTRCQHLTSHRLLQDFWTHEDSEGNEVQLDGDKSAFEVRFIVSSPGQRDVEGRFGPDTVMRILEHLDAEEGASHVAASIGAVQSPVTVNA